MLLWLEKSKPETRQTAFDKTSLTVLTRNVSEHTASDQAGSTPLLGAKQDIVIQQDTWPMIEFPGQLDPVAYIEAHTAMDWDASLWQGMLESLPWFSTSIDGPCFQ